MLIQDQKADCLVVELSSFQLDTIEHFRPDVAILLNITDDHMDRYPNFEAYVDSKARVFENQTSNDIAVLNGLDHAIDKISSRINSKKHYFYQKDKVSVRSTDFAVIEKSSFLSQPRISVHLENSKVGCRTFLNSNLWVCTTWKMLLLQYWRPWQQVGQKRELIMRLKILKVLHTGLKK
jgi:UDP-N-acetylmuramoylalanine-D-glutamate ligase